MASIRRRASGLAAGELTCCLLSAARLRHSLALEARQGRALQADWARKAVAARQASKRNGLGAGESGKQKEESARRQRQRESEREAKGSETCAKLASQLCHICGRLDLRKGLTSGARNLSLRFRVWAGFARILEAHSRVGEAKMASRKKVAPAKELLLLFFTLFSPPHSLALSSRC